MKRGGPPGWVRTSVDAPMAQVHAKPVDASLLISTADQEVIRYEVQPGAVVGLAPSESAEGSEVYVVLEGELECEVGGLGTVRSGDVLNPSRRAPGVMMRATRRTVLLEIATQPTFQTLYGGFEALQALSREVARKDGYTHDHCSRVRRMAFEVGRVMGLEPERLYWLSFGAYLHDVGKARIPSEVLLKPGPLTPAEWEIMRQHPVLGREMVEETQAARAAMIVGQHHERVDGSGYPTGLREDEILVESQIVAVVDTFDAITTDRPYHLGESPEAAVAELRRCRGTLFRADVVEAFVDLPELRMQDPEGKK